MRAMFDHEPQMSLFADQAARDFAAGYAHAQGGGAEPPKSEGRAYWLGWRKFQDERSGTELKQAGMRQAIEHADDVSAGWSDRAYRYVEYFARQRVEFRAEQVRAYAESQGLAAPPSNRAWGAVFAKAAKRKLIRRVGFVPCDNPKAHSAWVTTWVGK